MLLQEFLTEQFYCGIKSKTDFNSRAMGYKPFLIELCY